MKVIIETELTRPTIRWRVKLSHSFICRRDVLDERIAQYVYDRLHTNGYIPVDKFTVTIKNHRGLVVQHFGYKPTYR